MRGSANFFGQATHKKVTDQQVRLLLVLALKHELPRTAAAVRRRVHNRGTESIRCGSIPSGERLRAHMRSHARHMFES